MIQCSMALQKWEGQTEEKAIATRNPARQYWEVCLSVLRDHKPRVPRGIQGQDLILYEGCQKSMSGPQSQAKN